MSDLLDELREATRHRASVNDVVSTSPQARGWNHSKKCFVDREAADKSRKQLQNEVGTLTAEGHRLRWRIRPCSVCHGYYVNRDYRKSAWKRKAQP